MIGLTDIGGHHAQLVEGLRSHGIDAVLIDLAPDPFGYRLGRDVNSGVPRLARWAARARSRRERSTGDALVLAATTMTIEVVLRIALLGWALIRFDVFVFVYRTSFLKGADLPLLHLCGKRIIGVFHGSDERPPSLDGARPRTLDATQMARLTRRQKVGVAWFGRFVHEVICNPASAQFWERPVVMGQCLGIPFVRPSPKRVQGASREDGAPLVIVHAPTAPEAKGSDHVRSMIRTLQAEGIAIDYRELQGLPNHEVLAALQDADLAIDQLYSDTPLPKFATEASSFGVPVVIGGYSWDFLRSVLPDEAVWPAICRPEDALETVRRLAKDPDERAGIGRRCQEFVRASLTPASVAARYLRVIRGDVPESWRYDPAGSRQVHGSGLSEDQEKSSIRRLIEECGVRSLMVHDKPGLERALVEYATGCSGRSD